MAKEDLDADFADVGEECGQDDIPSSVGSLGGLFSTVCLATS